MLILESIQVEIRDIDPGYIRWMKEKVDREPVRTLLMQM